jgi:hypothetical protein
MATADYVLAPPPQGDRELELWLQNAAGFILFEDMRRFAIDRIDPGLSDEARAAARKGIDDAVYGLMMVLDGVTGALRNPTARVSVEAEVRLIDDNGREAEVRLADGDGMCMGFHGWKDGDFGEIPVASAPPG